MSRKNSAGSDLKGDESNVAEPTKLKFNLSGHIENDILAASRFIDK